MAKNTFLAEVAFNQMPNVLLQKMCVQSEWKAASESICH